MFTKNIFLRNINGRLAFASAVMMLSQINFGMDLLAFANTQAMPAFNKTFGAYDAHLKRYAIEPSFLSLLNSLNYIAEIFGVLIGGWIGRRYGRRISFWVMCGWAFVSAVLLVTAQTKEQILAGRMINYVYLGQELVTVPVFQAEICPSEIRGMIVGTYQMGTVVGSLLMAAITYGTSHIEGERSFRIPFGMFFVVPIIVAAGACFIRESPRWLLVRDRKDEALQSLRSYRAGKFTEEQIKAEFEEQRAMINTVTSDKGTFKELWQGTNLRRTLIAIGSNVCVQISGQGLVSKYGTIFLTDIHGPNPFQMFFISAGLQIVVLLLALSLFDKTGRKPNLIIGSIVQATSYFVIGGLGTEANPDKAAKITITAMFTLYYLGFVFGWGPIYHIISSEVPSSRMRDMTYAVASSITVLTQFIISFCIPYLLYAPYADLGAKVGFVFAPIAVLTLFFAIFCVPECRGLSLEQIDHLFRTNVPIRGFGKHRNTITSEHSGSIDDDGKGENEAAHVEVRLDGPKECA